MKTALSILAGAALALAVAGPASAAPVSGPQTAQPAQAGESQDMSAARKHRRHHVRVHPRGYYGWNSYASDPVHGRYPSMRRMQHLGRCVIDYGYGRYVLCN